MAENFNNYSKYYDLLYEDKDYGAEADYLINLITRLAPEAKQILELGSGTGNHAALLCRHGFFVKGIERSSEMVALANAKSIERFSCEVGDIRNYQTTTQYDVVISLFHVLSYLTNNNDLISCFKHTANHLKKGGLFIFDTWYTPAVFTQQPETRIKRMENDEIAVTRLAEPVIHHNLNVVDVNYEIIIQDRKSNQTEIYKETHPMRHFSIPEIELLAKLTGFELIHNEAFLSGAQAGPSTWGVCFILKKI